MGRSPRSSSRAATRPACSGTSYDGAGGDWPQPRSTRMTWWWLASAGTIGLQEAPEAPEAPDPWMSNSGVPSADRRGSHASHGGVHRRAHSWCDYARTLDHRSWTNVPAELRTTSPRGRGPTEAGRLSQCARRRVVVAPAKDRHDSVRPARSGSRRSAADRETPTGPANGPVCESGQGEVRSEHP